ncbi:MAG TPA: protein-L-isoaspartate O-methyltransferase, partial [Gemmatimonadales bacterium]|nr:protein-L-isoaspartate O-methyltransferase [Gemmatimonadales bacterium]
VTAGGPQVPPPLIEQLAPGGRMLIPLGERGAQVLTLVERATGGVRQTPLDGARFVPLLGEHGFDA